MNDTVAAMRALARRDLLAPPAWTSPDAIRRVEQLMEQGRQDLSLARLIEGHMDAVTILADAGRRPREKALYGVWASESPERLQLREHAHGLSLTGPKRFCSGAPLLDMALITAWSGERRWLVEVPLERGARLKVVDRWETPALRATATCDVTFEDLPLPTESRLGDGDWYFARPGFWHGALAPAACWAGGAMALRDALARHAQPRDDTHLHVHLGAMDAWCWTMRACFQEALREMRGKDEEPSEPARRRALRIRHLVERGCVEILDRFGRATGPRLLAFDRHAAHQAMDLTLYIRQCHAERDLETLGQLFPHSETREGEAEAHDHDHDHDTSTR